MNYRYNLYEQQAKHFAGLKIGDEMVVVMPFKRQPPEHVIEHGYKPYIKGDRFIFPWQPTPDPDSVDFWKTDLPYPFNARVGLRETWTSVISGLDKNKKGEWEEYPEYQYKADFTKEEQKEYSCLWLSAQCMPVEAIRFWATVVDVQVEKVQVISHEVAEIFMNKPFDVAAKIKLEHWLNHRYPGAWERNDWCAVATIRKEQ